MASVRIRVVDTDLLDGFVGPVVAVTGVEAVGNPEAVVSDDGVVPVIVVAPVMVDV